MQGKVLENKEPDEVLAMKATVTTTGVNQTQNLYEFSCPLSFQPQILVVIFHTQN